MKVFLACRRSGAYILANVLRFWAVSTTSEFQKGRFSVQVSPVLHKDGDAAHGSFNARERNGTQKPPYGESGEYSHTESGAQESAKLS